MVKTVWLNKTEINQIVRKIGEETTTHEYDTILKELNVAEIRAENTPILSKKFKLLIGKKENEIPVKFSEEEYKKIIKFL